MLVPLVGLEPTEPGF